MNRNAARFVQYSAGLLGLVALGWVLTGQASKPVHYGIPTDWSHRHVIFSRPATPERARQVEQDPRYWQQYYRQNIKRVLSVGDAVRTETVRAERFLPEEPFLRLRNIHRGSKTKLERDWSEDMGSGATVGAGNFPAKYSFDETTATCTDFVVYSTGLSSSSGASIVGFDNLYSGCSGSGPVPSTYFAYSTTALAVPGTINTSPVFSRDGTQIAFVQTDAIPVTPHGTLVLLKWKANNGSLSAPVSPTYVAPASYATCTAPCMTSFLLTNTLGTQTIDSNSSVFYDYTNDVAWVGDGLGYGYLHKFSPVFGGTPVEVRTSPWPVQVNSAGLSSPAYDHVSGNVFVMDGAGFLDSVSASSGAVTPSSHVEWGVTGFLVSPVVDVTSELVYAFISNDGTTNCGGLGCAAVAQFPATFTGGAIGTEVAVGASSASPEPLYDGIFDYAYESSANATGNIYVCGDPGGAPTLYQIPIAAGVMGTPVPGPALASAATGCSPVSDISNPNTAGGPTEWIFASAQASGNGNSCASGGCLMNFTATPWHPSTLYAVGQAILDPNFQIQVLRFPTTGGTSGTGVPAWSTTVGATTFDGSLRWINQGPQVAFYQAWAPATPYLLHAEVIDTNINIQLVITPGTSGAGPVWNTTPNGQTIDGTVHWRMVGALPTFSLPAAGGTSGLTIDNTVISGTLAGTSQVYFSTQSDQTCPTSTGTGGCAVQASQSALQ